MNETKNFTKHQNPYQDRSKLHLVLPMWWRNRKNQRQNTTLSSKPCKFESMSHSCVSFNDSVHFVYADFLMTDSEINKIKEMHNKRFVLNHFKKNILVGFCNCFATSSTKSRKPFSIRMLDSHDYFPLFCLVFCCLSVSWFAIVVFKKLGYHFVLYLHLMVWHFSTTWNEIAWMQTTAEIFSWENVKRHKVAYTYCL